MKAPARNSARRICLPLALESGWIGAVRIHGRPASSPGLCLPRHLPLPPAPQRVFLSGSSLHTSSVYEKNSVEDCSGLTSVDRGLSAPWPRAQARTKLTHVTAADRSFLRAGCSLLRCFAYNRYSVRPRRERQREEGGRSWLATVEPKSPRAITYSKL